MAQTRSQTRAGHGNAITHAPVASIVPDGYVSLKKFNEDANQYGRWPGLISRVADEDNIFVKIVEIEDIERVFLWWGTH